MRRAGDRPDPLMPLYAEVGAALGRRAHVVRAAYLHHAALVCRRLRGTRIALPPVDHPPGVRMETLAEFDARGLDIGLPGLGRFRPDYRAYVRAWRANERRHAAWGRRRLETWRARYRRRVRAERPAGTGAGGGKGVGTDKFNHKTGEHGR